MVSRALPVANRRPCLSHTRLPRVIHHRFSVEAVLKLPIPAATLLGNESEADDCSRDAKSLVVTRLYSICAWCDGWSCRDIHVSIRFISAMPCREEVRWE